MLRERTEEEVEHIVMLPWHSIPSSGKFSRHLVFNRPGLSCEHRRTKGYLQSLIMESISRRTVGKGENVTWSPEPAVNEDVRRK